MKLKKNSRPIKGMRKKCALSHQLLMSLSKLISNLYPWTVYSELSKGSFYSLEKRDMNSGLCPSRVLCLTTLLLQKTTNTTCSVYFHFSFSINMFPCLHYRWPWSLLLWNYIYIATMTWIFLHMCFVVNFSFERSYPLCQDAVLSC